MITIFIYETFEDLEYLKEFIAKHDIFTLNVIVDPADNYQHIYKKNIKFMFLDKSKDKSKEESIDDHKDIIYSFNDGRYNQLFGHDDCFTYTIITMEDIIDPETNKPVLDKKGKPKQEKTMRIQKSYPHDRIIYELA